MNSDKKSVIEMAGGPLLATVGIFLSQFPLPAMPNINHFFVHFSIVLGLAAIPSGITIFAVGAARYTTRLTRLIEKWDRMWTKRLSIALAAAAFCASLSVAWAWDALAQTTQPAPPQPGQSGCGSTFVGRDNNGTINPDCRTYNNFGPPRTQNGLYQDNTKVGSVEGIKVSPDRKEVTLNFPRFDTYVDLTKPIELQGAKILCDSKSFAGLPKPDVDRIVGVAGPVQCTILGSK